MGTGSIAKNFQQGARSEYLAQYAFSAFGTAIPAPRPEDSGIDLKCTLGHKKGMHFWVENYFYVQVKSDESEIRYSGKESVRWLLKLKLPLFICLVSKKKQRFEIFQTIGAYAFHSSNILQEITFEFNSSRNSLSREFDTATMFPTFDPKSAKVLIDLGKPILSFGIQDLSDQAKIDRLSSSLASWVKLGQQNLDNITTGFEMLELPDVGFQTNEDLPPSRTLGGNPFHLDESTAVVRKDVLYKSLSTLLLEVAEKGDVEAFDQVRRIIGDLVTKTEGRFTMGTIGLVFRENELAKKLGLEPYIHHPNVDYRSRFNPDDVDLAE